MINKNDLFLLLNDLKEKGVDVNGYIRELYSTATTPLSVIKFINEHRSLDIANFYEKLRYNYNHKRSNLYINIVKEVEDLEEILTTLASYNLQVLLYAKKIEDKEMFFRNTRVEEVTKVLNNYYKTFDIDACSKLLSLIKADIKLFESVK